MLQLVKSKIKMTASAWIHDRVHSDMRMEDMLHDYYKIRQNNFLR